MMRKYSEIVIPRREGNSCQVVTEIGHTGIPQPSDNSGRKFNVKIF